MLDLSMGFTALRCNLETILGSPLRQLHYTYKAYKQSWVNHRFNEAVSGVEKDGELMEEVESIEEKLWKVKLYSNKVFMVKYKNSESFYKKTLKRRNSVFSIMNL